MKTRCTGPVGWEGQVPTVPVTTAAIIRTEAFQAGVEDARRGFGFHPRYDQADTNWKWNYERGRQWARAAPDYLEPVNRAGKPTREAIRIFEQGEIP
jgi:hypothetical protein